MLKKVAVESAAEAYLELLASRGVEYFFGNAGTDFAPIIEAYAKRAARRARRCRAPHHRARTRSPPSAWPTATPWSRAGRRSVMVHVIVGTANALGGIINAARSHAPILVTAGRTPITEAGLPRRAATGHIHWAQESFDQGAHGARVREVGLRARRARPARDGGGPGAGHRRSEPQGPVYLTLPREVLAERHEAIEYFDPARAVAPRRDACRIRPRSSEAAGMLAGARNPIIITKSLGRDPAAVAALVRAGRGARRAGLRPVRTYLNFPQDHPLHGGFDAAPHLAEADADPGRRGGRAVVPRAEVARGPRRA